MHNYSELNILIYITCTHTIHIYMHILNTQKIQKVKNEKYEKPQI